MTYTINDILASKFAGRVERMVADIPGDSTEQQIADHLANNVEGTNVPSAAEVLAAVPIYEAELEASKKAALLAQAQANRAAAYREESDPLFFKWQRGEATQEEWLAKVAEIKARFPSSLEI